jgi:hypothetical protein
LVHVQQHLMEATAIFLQRHLFFARLNLERS